MKNIRWAKRITAMVLAAQLAWPAAAQTSSAPAKTRTARPEANRPSPALTERERAIHALNRLTFGPRPGDVGAVLDKGVDAWIEDQLHPESIDDSAMNPRLAPYATTRMNPKQLAQTFPSDGVIRQVISGKRPLPEDAGSQLIYMVNVARIKQQDAAKTPAANAPATNPTTPPGQLPAADSLDAQARAIADGLLALPKNQRLAALEKESPEQLVNFPGHLRPDQRDRVMADASPQERETIRAMSNPSGVVTSELQQAKVMREIYSERQLQEVMTDFWVNHFNVYQYKNQCVFYTTAYERDVIRPRALGKFSDLLIATAQSPAMLMYLDNWLSIGAHSQASGKNGESGLNENYAREVMELHTLGVDGGYQQTDVTELARVLTGWTIAQPDDGGQFQFDPRKHEPGTKEVLGEKLYGTGMDQGIRALEMLAHHPSTARFISKELAMRFVADDPPAALVNRMAAKFQSSAGDIREVLRTMFTSPEFWSPKVYGAKLKTPLELVVSAVRASGANVAATDALVQALNNMGMQPYGMIVPTGYSEKAKTWDNEGALLARINFSTALTQGNLSGVPFDPSSLLTQAVLTSLNGPHTKAIRPSETTGLDFAIALLEDATVPGELAPNDEAVIRKETEDQDGAPVTPLNRLRLVTGFLLASPEFQHH